VYSLLSKLNESICKIIIKTYQKIVLLWGESTIKYTQKVALSSCSHIFTQMQESKIETFSIIIKPSYAKY
jgi:hypothetical protein